MIRLNTTAANRSGHLSQHSLLAMKAARKMARTRDKEKTGRVICHHLLKMLEVETPTVTTVPTVQQAQEMLNVNDGASGTSKEKCAGTGKIELKQFDLLF